MASFISVYITNPSEEKAREIARHLLERRLIACGNIVPSRSLYWWEGKIEDQNEHILLCKTTEEKWEQVKTEVEKIHPYSVPCILKFPFQANERYATWLVGEVMG